ncbi:MAG TPA: ABC transporter ATP-binding protein [Clostridiaceae bacterium]|nr:ABC transporter ATP-binding protein [Clostridiaceae bacterium]
MKKSIVGRFISYYKPYRWTLFLDLFCAAVIGLAGVIFPVILRSLTGRVFLMPDTTEMMRQLWIYAGVLLVLYIVQALATYYMATYGHIMGARMETDMRDDLFTHMEKLSFSFFDKTNTGQMMSRLISDLADVTELAHHGPENIFIAAVKMVGAFIVLFLIHLPTTLVLLTVTILMFIFTLIQRKKMQRTFMENRRRIADVNAVVMDSLSGIRTVQSYSNEEIEAEKFDQGNKRFLESKIDNYLVMGEYQSVNGFMQGMMYLAVILVGGLYVARGELLAADIILYVLYISMFLDPIKMLVNFTEQFQKGMTGFQRMVEILETEPEVQDRPDAIEMGVLDGDIEFSDVNFRYNEDEPVLENIRVSISSGSTVALVGPSGAGKSTFVSLIPRFYDVSSGQVTVDGVDVRDMTLKSLRANIGVVQQDVYIFNSSVRNNIAYGRPGATDEDIVAAAQDANIHDFIMTLPQGYDTMMGERGVRFSGGQKQRISIARVFLKNPPILILDEATSSLDNESELFIQSSLDKLSRDRTTLVIAHRLSTIKSADNILVLTEEGIVEQGTHESLLAAEGVYAYLYHLQFLNKADDVDPDLGANQREPGFI